MDAVKEVKMLTNRFPLLAVKPIPRDCNVFLLISAIIMLVGTRNPALSLFHKGLDMR